MGDCYVALGGGVCQRANCRFNHDFGNGQRRYTYLKSVKEDWNDFYFVDLILDWFIYLFISLCCILIY